MYSTKLRKIKTKHHCLSYKKENLTNFQNTFMIKVLEKLGMHGTYVYLMMVVYSKAITHINLNGKKLKLNLLKSERGQSCLLPTYFFNIAFDVLPRITGKLNELEILNEEFENKYLLVI